MLNLKDCLRLLRPHQWTKNLLCLAPLILSHRWRDPVTLLMSLKGMVTFCVVSSLAYVINDMMDVRADRSHPRKCTRPLASGAVSIRQAYAILGAACCMLLGLLSSQPWDAILWIAIYLGTTLAYSFRLKRYLALDVVLLSMFYAVRLAYGGAVSGIQVTAWTMIFALFVFLTLALVKRVSEIQLMEAADDQTIGGKRPYRCHDKVVLLAQACASAYTSLLVLALYLHTTEVTSLYTRSQILWLLLPLLIYWLSRLLFIANRGEMHHDPVVFALRDRVSWSVLLLGAGVLLLAM